MTKVCNKCGTRKPLDQFSPHKRGVHGRHGTCRTCRAEYARQYREEHPLVDAAVSRRYREKYPERQREAERRFRAAQRDADRKAVLDHYGRACACCGSTDRLTIDHINGDGKQHRAEIGVHTGAGMYRWLVRNGLPDGFQTLCRPCNTSKGRGARCRLDHGLRADAA